MALPDRPLSVLLFMAIGALAFRGIGLIIAAVSNSVAESNLLVQMLYMPMMFLSGAMFPAAIMPRWAQTVAHFMPAAYLVSGVESIVTQNQTLGANGKAIGGMLLTLVLAMFVAVRLFRWEKEEKIRASAKLWVVAALLPFLLLGVWQSLTHHKVIRTDIFGR